MLQTVKQFWSDLDVNCTVNKRELALGLAACTLGGMVLGMLLSPKSCKQVTVHTPPAPPEEMAPADGRE